MQTYAYPSYEIYHDDVRNHRNSVQNLMRAMKTGESNGKLLTTGNAYLIAERVPEPRLTIFMERGSELIQAVIGAGGFEMVRVISKARVIKATTVAEIEALPVYADLVNLWDVAKKRRLIA